MHYLSTRPAMYRHLTCSLYNSYLELVLKDTLVPFLLSDLLSRDIKCLGSPLLTFSTRLMKSFGEFCERMSMKNTNFDIVDISLTNILIHGDLIIYAVFLVYLSQIHASDFSSDNVP